MVVSHSVHFNPQGKMSTAKLEVGTQSTTPANMIYIKPRTKSFKDSGGEGYNSKSARSMVVWLSRDIMGKQRSGEGN
jgi:hypothetical protein